MGAEIPGQNPIPGKTRLIAMRERVGICSQVLTASRWKVKSVPACCLVWFFKFPVASSTASNTQEVFKKCV